MSLRMDVAAALQKAFRMLLLLERRSTTSSNKCECALSLVDSVVGGWLAAARPGIVECAQQFHSRLIQVVDVLQVNVVV
eukprot:5590148-Amphidinium_carterae.1